MSLHVPALSNDDGDHHALLGRGSGLRDKGEGRELCASGLCPLLECIEVLGLLGIGGSAAMPTRWQNQALSLVLGATLCNFSHFTFVSFTLYNFGIQGMLLSQNLRIREKSARD